MTLRPIALALSAAVLSLASAAVAQDAPPPIQTAPETSPTPSPGPQPASAPGGMAGMGGMGGMGMGGGGGGMMPRTADEVAAWSDRLFQRLDADQDGALVSAELLVLTQGGRGAMGGSRLRAMIAQSDSSQDARVTREEMAAGAGRMFTRMDKNGDGRLADDELPQPPAQQRPPAIPMPTPAPMPMPMPMPEG